MADLIAPHGGIDEPVSCTVPEAERDAFAREASSLQKVPVSDADLSTVYRFGDGALLDEQRRGLVKRQPVVIEATKKSTYIRTKKS